MESSLGLGVNLLNNVLAWSTVKAVGNFESHVGHVGIFAFSRGLKLKSLMVGVMEPNSSISSLAEVKCC